MNGQRAQLRGHAWEVVALFAGSVIYGVMLLLAFDPEVQGVDPDELFGRTSDARAFLVADLIFPLIYGPASALAQWRFGRSLTGGRPPRLFIGAAVALSIAAILDVTENVVLLAAIESESAGLVDFAHALAVPKVVAFTVGAALALVVLVRAIATLRQQ